MGHASLEGKMISCLHSHQDFLSRIADLFAFQQLDARLFCSIVAVFDGGAAANFKWQPS